MNSNRFNFKLLKNIKSLKNSRLLRDIHTQRESKYMKFFENKKSQYSNY